ncbi:hypothetical protein Nepgr_014992 [Nepenthes gracilis]|uniref:Uncharacterized protein n=1 Tax=Nepenthes gracilis TaxID=150966 RepID=A0AAD3SMU2_NEPGR|nr:hypothetical protein Nepgr_014992 [Nepenthes gracilis]
MEPASETQAETAEPAYGLQAEPADELYAQPLESTDLALGPIVKPIIILFVIEPPVELSKPIFEQPTMVEELAGGEPEGTRSPSVIRILTALPNHGLGRPTICGRYSGSEPFWRLAFGG